MKRQHTTWLAALALLIGSAGVGLGQLPDTGLDADATAALAIEGIEVADPIILEAGGTAEVPVTVRFSADAAAVDVVTITLSEADGETLATTTLSTAEGDTLGGTLQLAYTTPAGDHTLTASATGDLLGGALESSTTATVATLLAVDLQQSTLDFGEGGPNTWLGPAALTVVNQGNVPVDVQIRADPMSHEGAGDPIAPERLEARSDGQVLGHLSEDPFPFLGLGVGGSTSLDLWLHLPSGSTQYLPPGAYTGAVTVEVGGVVE